MFHYGKQHINPIGTANLTSANCAIGTIWSLARLRSMFPLKIPDSFTEISQYDVCAVVHKIFYIIEWLTSSTLRLHQVPVAKLYKSKFVLRWRFRYWKETTSNSLNNYIVGIRCLFVFYSKETFPVIRTSFHK